MQLNRLGSFVAAVVIAAFVADVASAAPPAWVFSGDANRLIGDPLRGTDENYTNTIPGPPAVIYYTPANLKNGTAPVAGPVAGQFESLRVGSGGTLGINLPQPMKVPATDPRSGIPDPFVPTNATAGNLPNVPAGGDYWGARAGVAVQWQTNQDGSSVMLTPAGIVNGQAFSITPRNLFSVAAGLTPSGSLAIATPINDGLAPGSAVEAGPVTNTIGDFVPWLRSTGDPGKVITGYGITTWDTASVAANLAFLTAGLDQAAGTPDDVPASVVTAALVGRVNLWEGGSLFEPGTGGTPPGNFNELNFNFAGGSYAMSGDGLNAGVDGTLLLTGTLEDVRISNVWTADILTVVDPDGTPNNGDEFFVAKPGTVRRTIKVAGNIHWDGGSLQALLSSTNGVFSVNYNNIPFTNTTGQDTDTAYDFVGDAITSYDASMTFDLATPKLEVTKTAETSFTRTWTWNIEKTCDPTELTLAPGTTAPANFEATVCPVGSADSDFAVQGTITIHNPTAVDATIESISDVVSPDIAITPTCNITFPYTLPAGGTLTCTYASSLPDNTSRTNSVTVATSGPIDGDTATATVDFSTATINEIDECVAVSDDKGGNLGTACAADGCKTFKYSLDVGPFGQCGPQQFTNTASFTANDTGATGASACSIDVTVPCPLEITKDAHTSLKRTWTWTINKVCDPSSVVLGPGQTAPITFRAEACPAGSADGDFTVEGTITIHNPTASDATIESVSDTISPNIPAIVTSSVTFPYTLPAGETLTCTYQASLPDGTARINTVTVTTSGVVSGGTATADVDFSTAAVSEVDSCVTVTDDKAGDLGTLCVADGCKTFEYGMTVGPFAECGSHDFTNTATFTTNDTGTSGSSGCTVEATVPCPIEVKKDAHTSYKRVRTWTIDKKSCTTCLTLCPGKTSTVNYEVRVCPGGTKDSDFAVTGTITVHNPAPVDVTITDISDVVSPNIPATLTCGITFPYTLPAGGTLTCTYTATLPNTCHRTNTVTVTTDVPGVVGTATADVDFANATVEEADKCVTVTDDKYGPLGTVCAGTRSGSRCHSSGCKVFRYSLPVGPFDGCGKFQFTNTASFTGNDTGTTGSDSWTVNVTVPCRLEVSKDAHTSVERAWKWKIEKKSCTSALTLSPGQQSPVNYEVTVCPNGSTDRYVVEGTVTVHNPSSVDATITGITDVISSNIHVPLQCDLQFPFTLPAGQTLTCTYRTTLPSNCTRTNKVTVTTRGAVAGGCATATVDFRNAPTKKVDACVNVTDDKYGDLGTVCASKCSDCKTFKYALPVGPYDTCGTYKFVNTATYTTADTGATGSAAWTVNVSVPCGGGCTLTYGYWKTHAACGSASKPDPTWKLIQPNGQDTKFFLSGQSYIQVLQSNPSWGNAYYILAHQYIAAQLNQLKGASIPPDVLAAFNTATTLFQTYTPSDLDKRTTQATQLKTKFTNLGATLDDYNSGRTGPGHCEDDRCSTRRH